MNTKKKYIKTTIILIAALLLLSFGITSCSSEEEEFDLVQQSRFALGTYNQVTVYATEELANEVIDGIFDRVAEIENAMSLNVADSEINQLNEARGEAFVTVSEDTFKLLKRGKEVAEETDGAFNIGIGQLIALWDISGDDPQVPPEEEIDTLFGHFDLNQLELREDTLEARINDPMMTIDLGGIAKGYAVDEAIKVAKDYGIEHAIIDFGGDVYVLGGNPNGNEWRIGITNPIIGEGGVVARIFSSDMSIVSSGDYERYFIENDRRYHHILDPETGFPADNELNSVTIVSDTALDGDIYSTAIFVMGLDKGLAFIESLDSIEGALITKDNDVYVSSGLSERFEMMNESFHWVNE